MAADILDYTTTDAVRGALGLDTEEIPDEMLVEQGLETALLADLDDWLPTHPDIWATGFSNTAEAVDKQRQRWLQLYSMWYCAAYVAEMHPSWPQMMSDGKMQIRRFANLDFDALMNRTKGHRDRYKGYLLASYGTATPTRTFISGVRAEYDPVVGGTDQR